MTVDRSQLPAPRGKSTVHVNDARMRRVRAYVLARDRDPVTRQVTCGICGHPGADGVDHVVPVSECEVRQISPYDTSNMKAAHSKVPCQVCMQAAAALGNRAGFCNALRGSKSYAAVALLLARRTQLTILGTRPDGPGAPVDGERPW